MKTFSRNKTMAAVVLAVATVGLPATSYAQTSSSYRYEECKKSDKESQLVGGLIGAVAGGVAGSQVAANGARTEGSALGAVLGAAAGAAIANKDCGDDRIRRTTRRSGYNYGNTYGTNRNYGTTYGSNRNYGATTYRTGHRSHNHPGRGHAWGRSINSSRWGYNQGSHTCGRNETRVEHLKWQIEELRRERSYLKDRSRYVRYDRDLDRRIYWIGEELERLKRELKYAKKDRDRDYRDYRDRDYRDRDYRDYRSRPYYYKSKN